ncbi:MAG: TonB-dependent receptor [Gammaproteobacteria bacterium]|jgi:outer membrane receptor protein involved in Fe transport|nr:TonB-dependent receptor [Gammaproteobacteria bacterium]MDP6616577.1 TonB-dependent receptor [Gammaproteobacteria bacterium]
MITLRFQFSATALAVVVFSNTQGAGSQRLPDEIVVSGFRSTTNFELDSSASVLDAQTIEQSAVENFEELVHLIPNMSLSGEGSRARYFQIRGVGEREQYEGAPNPSVGYIIDDIDLSGIGGISSTFDLQQIDVLRGPQSARYGSSALAGIVYVQSALPGDEFSSELELGGGSDDMWSVGAAVDGPMTDKLGGRLSVHYYEDDGFRDNDFLGQDDTNGREELTVRGKLSFDFADAWNVLWSGLYADYDNGYDAWSLANDDTVLSDEPGEDSQETSASSLKFTGPLNAAVDFVSITSVARSEIVFAYDADWANADTFLPGFQVAYSSDNPRERDTVSQEFRLVSGPEGKLFGDTTDWVVGLYLQRLEEDNELTNPGDYVDGSVFCPAPGSCPSVRAVTSEHEADTIALFAGTESALSDKLGLSVGLRVERWDADYTDTWLDTGIFNPGTVAGTYEFSPDENMTGGHVALNYDWSDELRGYVRIARGFKAGGFNPSLNAMADNGVPGQYGAEFVAYDPEYLWNYELGLKSLWLDGSLGADISIFYMDRRDAQLSQSDQLAGDPAAFIFVTYNGDAKSKGVEASLTWQATEVLQVYGSVGLLRTEIDDWDIRPMVEGRELAHAPDYTLNIGAAWEGPAGWSARADINSVGDYYFDISHDQKSGSYRVVNLRVTKEWDNWAVSLWGRNIFDEDYATRGFYFVNEPPYDPADTRLYTRFGDPRQAGFTVRYSY